MDKETDDQAIDTDLVDLSSESLAKVKSSALADAVLRAKTEASSPIRRLETAFENFY
jgi:hypothetical protein